MIKAEIYKLFHSKYIYILLIIVISIALYLGVMLPQMGIVSEKEVLDVALVGASAVIMLYIMVLATMLINRDYSSNTYRILIGMGISRNYIFITKYIIFLAIGIIVVVFHSISTYIATRIIYIDNLKRDVSPSVFLYLIVYISIISMMFLLAIIGRTTLKSIIFNIVFLILTSIFSMFSFGGIKILPLHFLQMISDGKNEQYIEIVIMSILYTVIIVVVSYFIQSKQEL